MSDVRGNDNFLRKVYKNIATYLLCVRVLEAETRLFLKIRQLLLHPRAKNSAFNTPNIYFETHATKQLLLVEIRELCTHD